MNCPYCGNQVAEGSAFCGNCGAKVEAQPSSAPATVVEALSSSESVPADAPTAPSAYTSPPPAPLPAKKSNRNLIIVIIVLAMLALCCCCVFFILPMILGPSIAEIFGQVGSSLGTLTPTPARLR